MVDGSGAWLRINTAVARYLKAKDEIQLGRRGTTEFGVTGGSGRPRNLFAGGIGFDGRRRFRINLDSGLENCRLAYLANLAVLRGGLVVMLVGEGAMKDEQKQSPHCQQTYRPSSNVPPPSGHHAEA